MSRRKFKKSVATNLDQAYTLYMQMHQKPPTASRFKTFINDDKRVQMHEVDFVTCDHYLRSSGKGRNSIDKSSSRLAKPRLKHTSSASAASSSSAPRKKPKLRASFSNTQSSSSMSSSSKKRKHYRSTKSLEIDPNAKHSIHFTSNNKSREERPITSVPSLKSVNSGSKKRKDKSKRKRDKKGKIEHHHILKPSAIAKKSKKKKKDSKKSKKSKRQDSDAPVYGNGNATMPLSVEQHDSSSALLEPLGDDELTALLEEIPVSPLPAKNRHNDSNIILPSANSDNLLNIPMVSSPTGNTPSTSTTSQSNGGYYPAPKSQSVELKAMNAVLKSFPFYEHMTVQEAEQLTVKDKIDHRNPADGQYLVASILQVNGSKLRIKYDKAGPYKVDIWSDYKYELFRFAKHHSITLRPAHRMLDIEIGNTIDCNPRRAKKKNHHGWRVGEVIKKDYKSGQIKVEYTYKKRKHQYWTHLDNVEEVSPFMTMVDMPSSSDHEHSVHEKSDAELKNSDEEMDNTPGHFQMFNMDKFKDLNLDTSILYQRSGHDFEHGNSQNEGGYTPKNNNNPFVKQSNQFGSLQQKSSKSKTTTQTRNESPSELDYEDIYEWNTQEVMRWFDTIDGGRFATDPQYEELRSSIVKWSIKGKELLQFNHVFLNMLGVTNEKERQCILDEIQKIAPDLPDIDEAVIGKHVRKLSNVEIEKGIEKGVKEVKQKYTREKKQLQTQISSLQQKNKEIEVRHSEKLSELQDLQKMYQRLQRDKKKPSSQVQKLKQQNDEMKQQLADLTNRNKQQQKQIQAKDGEVQSLQKQIKSMNKELTKKEKKITALKNQKDQEIIQLKMELKVMADKYEKLNVEHTKQQQLLRQQQQQRQRQHVQHSESAVEIRVDATRNGQREQEQQQTMNGHPHIDDDHKSFDNNEEIKAPPSIETNTTEDTPESTVSVEIESVNSADDDDEHEQMDEDEYRTIIIDNGSETIKIGYGSSDDSHKPTKKFHSIIATPKKTGTGPYSSGNEVYIGDEAYSAKSSKRSILDITNVIQRGYVHDWDKMEKLWHYTFHKKLGIPQSKGLSSHNVLLTECVLNKKENREKSTQIMFESFDINSLYMANEAVLSLYGTGRATGCVLGIGYGVTYSTAIYESMLIPNSIIKVNSAGHDLTTYLRQILSEKYSSVLKATPHSIIKDMKQKYCFVAENFHEALKQNANTYKKYKLPDGQCIRIGTERFQACEQLFGGFMNINHETMGDDNKKLFNQEAAFNNSGIHHMLHQTIRSVQDADIQQQFYSNVVLSGGSTLFRGLIPRLKSETNKLMDAPITVIANEKRKYLAWIGGSIISSLTHFQQQFIARSEYDEYGPGVVHRKCLQ